MNAIILGKHAANIVQYLPSRACSTTRWHEVCTGWYAILAFAARSFAATGLYLDVDPSSFTSCC